jgi:DNA-binding NarL/FixJ family response regulator
VRVHHDTRPDVRDRAPVPIPVPGEITVLVADDDPRVGLAVAALLDQEPDFRVVAHSVTGDDAVAAAGTYRPALVLADVRMPGGGPELVRRLVALAHRPVVAGFSAQADAATWTAVLAAGGSGYLLKGSGSGDLPVLLRRCMQGHVVVGVPGAAEVLRSLLTR